MTSRGKTLRRFAPFLVLVMCMAIAMPSMAQTTTATVRGTVTDESGNIFPGVVITATNLASGFRYEATSGGDGNYNLAGVTPGRYRIDVSGPSYKGSSREVTLQVGQTIDADFRLTPDLVISEEITVLGSNVAVETRTTEVATNVTRQQIENLPQGDRNFLNFAALAPGVLLSTNPERKEIRAGAQGASFTNVFIDGVSLKNDVIQGGVIGQDSSRGNPFPQNAVQEFRVITQNFSAEYQKASSAIITAVTKSGSNALTGDVFWYFQDKSLVEDNPLTGENPEYERNQYGLSIGGPIIRDRMHYFLSYERNDQTRENTVKLGGAFANNTALRQQLSSIEGTFASPFESDLAFGKLSFQPNARQLVEWSGTYRDESDISGFGGITAREAAENKLQDVLGTTLRHQLTGSTWLNEFNASLFENHWNPSPLNPDEIGFVYEDLARIGGRDTEQDIGQQRLAFRDDISFSNLNWVTGNHGLKVGANVELLDYTVTKFFEENPRYFFRQDISATIPYKARYGFGNPDLSANNEQFGIYVQDDWDVNDRLLLNLGIRWDYETNMINTDFVTPQSVRDRLAGEFPAKFFTDGDDREAPMDLFQPRLGVSYDFSGSGRTVVFAGAGRYYDRNLFNNTLDESFRLQHSVGEFFFSETGDPIPQLGNTPAVKWDPAYLTREGLQQVLSTGRTGNPEVFLIENDTKVPYSDQFNLGVRQAFGALLGSASYARIRSYNGFSYLWGKGACCPQYPPFSNVLISSDDVRTWYDAVYVTLDRPYTSTGNYGFNFAYTYSDAEQVGGDLFSLDLPTIADWPRYGTPGTSDHRIVANGIVGLPWEIRLSTLLQYSSGDKFKVNDRRLGFCPDCYRPLTGEGPSWTTIDLRAEKGFSFGRNTIAVIGEVFNITNEKRYEFYDDFLDANDPRYGTPTAIVSGSQRRFQVGLRYQF
jgi:outer membrane receptor protein involved in Fe transport